METRILQLNEFFERYRDVFNEALKGENPDIEQTARLFSASFIAANPAGVNCGQNNESFIEAMKDGYSFYKTIGITSMDIVSLKTTLLDEFHAMTRIRWKSHFVKNDKPESIGFENIYFTQSLNVQPKVFAWITGDEQAELKKIGLV